MAQASTDWPEAATYIVGAENLLNGCSAIISAFDNPTIVFNFPGEALLRPLRDWDRLQFAEIPDSIKLRRESVLGLAERLRQSIDPPGNLRLPPLDPSERLRVLTDEDAVGAGPLVPPASPRSSAIDPLSLHIRASKWCIGSEIVLRQA